MSIIKATAKVNSIFLAVVLIFGTFAAVYPSFINGIQAQSEYEYENDYEYEYNDNDSYNLPEYTSQQPYEYPQQAYDEYEYNNDNDNYYYPPTEEPISADIVVPNDFDTIQEAIDAADEGDVIKVLPGTYTEQLTISKNLTIIGSGPMSTIIEASGVLDPNVLGFTYIVEINNGAEVSMKGFTIQGPEGTECDSLTGVSVLDNGIIDLKYSILKDVH